MSDYQNIKVKKLENSEMEIEGEISVEKVEAHIDEAMRRLGEDVAMPGFRKGHVPPKILKQRLGEMAVWTEAAEYALRAEYPTILKAALEKVKDAEPISAPEVTITKMAPGNPLGFKMRIALMPEVKLPDYKKIARERTKDKGQRTKDLEVTDKEVEELMTNLQKARAGHEKVIKNKSNDHDNDSNLPVFNDEFARSLGSFKDVEDFKKKARENLLEEKKMRAKEELRFGIIDAIVSETKVSLPEVLIEGELQQMFAQFEGDITRAGFSMVDYMKRANKTEEDLKKEWRGAAEKRAKTQLALHAIAEAEKLEPEKEKVEESVARMMAQYKDADERRARAYITSVLLNEKVFEFLEAL
ncbi:MAG: trigger factor [bacterium]|nr:trigger factor [bacterium]